MDISFVDKRLTIFSTLKFQKSLKLEYFNEGNIFLVIELFWYRNALIIKFLTLKLRFFTKFST